MRCCQWLSLEMMWTFKKFVLCLLVTWAVCSEGFITSHLTETDKTRLKQVFDISLETKELAATHYSVLGYKELNLPIPKQNEVCKLLLESLGGTGTVETYFYSIVAWKTIGSCPGSLPTAAAVKVLTEGVVSETSSALTVYQAAATLKALGQTIPQITKVVKNLQAILNKDDSVTNYGYVLHTASLLGKDGAFALDKVESAIVQADEVDSKYLQFEGGLSITALVVSGAYQLGTVLNKAPAITPEQAVKFANYFLSRRSVQTPKGAYLLINILNLYTTNKFQVVAVVSGVGGGRVSKEEPKLTVRLSDVLGQQLAPNSVLTLESATRKSDSLVIASKNKFTQSPQDKSVYWVSLLESKPEFGVYEVKVSVSGGDPRLVGKVNIGLTATILAQASLEQVRIGKADSDLSTQPKYESVSFPGGKVSEPLELDTMQKLSLRFLMKDKWSGKPLTTHQVFLLFRHTASGKELIFLTDHDSAPGSYKLDLDVGGRGGEFGHVSGVYEVHLVVGDVVLSNPFSWHLADVSLKLGEQSPTAAPSLISLYQPKPEIKHLFREPEKRPPVFVSNMFTALCALPLLLLVILWFRVGINFSNFPISLSCIGFHIGFGSIFCLFGLFWWKLNMFETLKYMSAVGPFTFLCGVKTLSKIASQKKH